MSDYKTLNKIPSADPRDLDDNATVFDQLINRQVSSWPDRLGTPRKTWYQMELDAQALVSPNVSSLASLSGAPGLSIRFTGAGTLATYSLTELGRTLAGVANAAAARTAIGAIALTDTGAFSGSAAKLTTARTLSLTGDASASITFDGSANASASLTLSNSGVTAGTYNRVTVDAKGRITAGQNAPIAVANGGTGSSDAATARSNLGVLAVTDKPAWQNFTPSVSATSGSYTTASATGSYIVLFGVCHFRMTLTVTTKGTGVTPVLGLPVAALSGSVSTPLLARESAVNGKTGAAVITAGLTTVNINAYDNTDLVSSNGAVITVAGSYPVA